MSTRPSPNPVALIGFFVVFMTFGVFGGWAAVAKLDSAVVAPGMISLEGNRRVVQHFEGGIVADIHVDEADIVSQGDILVSLNDVEARSNMEVLTTRLNAARLIEARLVAERNLDATISFPEDLMAKAPNDTALTSVLRDQESIFGDRRDILDSRAQILSKRVGQLNVQIEGLELQRSAFERRIDNFTGMIERMREGVEKGLIQANMVATREDELIQIEASLGQVISDVAQTQTVIGETELEVLQLQQQFRERASTELDAARADINELTERMKVAEDVLARTEIRAPGSGTIQNLKVHTVGSVVRPGDVLMELVPEDEQLVVNAQVSPLDIDNVVTGLETEIRFTAFRANKTPIVLGFVDTVSQDVITPDNPNQQPYYLARIKIEDVDVPEDIRGRLTAGMPADVIISTGERTVANYITAPLMDAVRKSMVEE